MINTKDLYTFNQNVPLVDTTTSTTIGTAIITYEIRRYKDLRNLGNRLAYQIMCTQRIIIPNQTPYIPGGQDILGFFNYPAIITNNIKIMPADGGVLELIAYSPRTINSAISTSSSSDNGIISSISHQHTSGSSTSQSNSFGASASLGFFGDLPTGNISVDASHSWGSGNSQSASSGSGTSNSSQNSSNDAMTVKDWACYSYLDPGDTTPTWIWGQEYPWDVIQFRNQNGGLNIELPMFIQSLLSDGLQPLPPSQLSLFGVDFTMKSVWIVDPADTDTASITHQMQYYTASHQLNSTNLVATISAPLSFSYTSPAIDLCVYGLDPILHINANNVAIIGFIPNKFITLPAAAAIHSAAIVAPVPFKIISSNNNILIQDTTPYSSALTISDAGAGFAASETALIANFTPNCTSLQITLNFKVIDTINNYMLFMKHWKTGTTGVMLTILLNDDITAANPANPIVKYVDASEAEGGENNMLSLALRNLNYGSVDYHDFIQLGLNTIQITITPIGGAYNDCGYQIRAISIEKS